MPPLSIWRAASCCAAADDSARINSLQTLDRDCLGRVVTDLHGKAAGQAVVDTIKSAVAADLIVFFGEDVIRRLLDGVRPGWESDLRTVRDRHLCLVANPADLSRQQQDG